MSQKIAVKILLMLFFFIPSTATFSQTSQGAYPSTSAWVLTLNGAIGPAANDYLSKGLLQAIEAKANLVIILLDTPGGLEKTMRSMVASIIHSPIPVITYVSPSGARAASAGTFILYASHIAAMAPGTNVGAASPVSLISSSEKKKDMSLSTAENKAMNDASAYIRSLAQLRHRNITWAEQAVTKGVSLSANEALQLKVIDIVATDLKDLLQRVNGRLVTVQNQQVLLNTSNIKLKTFSPDWRTNFLSIITDPNIAYILLLVGLYGLIFEFLNPGFILPGVAGLISLLVALYAFQLLPINYVGLGLILVGVAFIITEAFVPSFGALGVGGIIAFIVGSVMLFDRQIPGFTLMLTVIIAVSLVTVAFLILIVQLAIRAQKRPIVSGREELINSSGKIILMKGEEGLPRIRIRGELWQVRSSLPLQEGQLVKVVGIDELILIVVPVTDSQMEEGKAP